MIADDDSLLKRWVAARDAEAFAELVQRHAGLVYGTCRRIVRNHHAAEDVAQDCLLEFARKAESVRTSVAGFLYSLATTRARDRLRNDGARGRHETISGAVRPAGAADREPTWEDLAPFIDEALAQLSDEERLPLVLHFLDGRSQMEVAAELGCGQASVSRRIASGIAALRERLGRAGITTSLALLSGTMAANAAESAPPALLAAAGKMAMAGIGSTAAATPAAAAMATTINLKLAVAASVAAVLAVGAAVGYALATKPAPPVMAPAPRTVTTPLAVPTASLSGDTSAPAHSYFVIGQPVQLTFSAAHLAPRSRDRLDLHILDEHGVVVQDLSVPVSADSSGAWSQVVDAPHAHLGFYRVRAGLESGADLAGRGSRPAGFLTYAVVPDPARRAASLPMDAAFFGILGLQADIPELPALLGSRWLTFGRWDADCPTEPLSPIPWHDITWPRRADGTAWNLHPAIIGVAFASNCPWADQVFEPGTSRLIPGSGEQLFAERCLAVARAALRDHAEAAKRIYQVWDTFETSAMGATAEDLSLIYRIAHRAIHSVDPQAVVAGIAFGSASPTDRRPSYDQLYDAGLFDHLDALSIHLYLDADGQIAIDKAPETVSPSQRQTIRDLKTWMRQRLGRELPIYGTEQGFRTGPAADPAQELRQAQFHVRSNLILLGEGLACNWAFFATDFESQAGYGFNYDLAEEGAMAAVAPKPSAAAYAAMTFLLEGRTQARALTGLGQTGMGYAYSNGSDEVLALWDYGSAAAPLEMSVDAASVTIYDWMGNGRQMMIDRGMLRVELGNEPIYVVKPVR